MIFNFHFTLNQTFFFNRPVPYWEISIWDYIQNSKTLFLFNEYGSYQKNCHQQNNLYVLILQWYLRIWSKSDNLWEEYVEFSYDPNLFQNYGEYEQKITAKYFNFRFKVWIPFFYNSNCTGWKIARKKSLLWCANRCQGFILTAGQYFCNKYPKIFAKFDTSIRDVNYCPILY